MEVNSVTVLMGLLLQAEPCALIDEVHVHV
jgi:hypothetical protein